MHESAFPVTRARRARKSRRGRKGWCLVRKHSKNRAKAKPDRSRTPHVPPEEGFTFVVRQVDEKAEAAVRRAKASRADLLKPILAEPGAQQAFDELVVSARCDRAFLESYLTEPVESAKPGAKARKSERNLAKQLVGTVKKMQRLLNEFREMSGEPAAKPYLDDALSMALEQVRPWAERPRPVLLFTPRQNQQFRLLKHIRQRTRRWHFREAARLLCTVYTFHQVPEEQHPTEKSIAYLVDRFKKNQRKSRLKAAKTR